MTSASSSPTRPLTPIPATAELGPHGDMPGLIYLARGTFGAVYRREGEILVYKVVEVVENNEALSVEFERYTSVHAALSLNLESSSSSSSRDPRVQFSTPQPYTYLRPPSGANPADARRFNSSVTSSPSRASLAVESMQHDLPNIPHASMMLDLIPPLPTRLTTLYRQLFWRDKLANSGPTIRLLRLYLGRTFPETSSQIAPGIQSDPPLDIRRYRMLDEALRSTDGSRDGEGQRAGAVEVVGDENMKGLPSLQNVAYGMGEVLARLHWAAGTNGRDIELVLGGEDMRCWILDYNQSQPWLTPNLLSRMSQAEPIPSSAYTTAAYASNTLAEASGRLGVLIATQEFYYARPDTPELYERFKMGYLNTVNALLGYYTPEAESEAWLRFAQEVREAAGMFFIKYGEVSAARAERASRRAGPSR